MFARKEQLMDSSQLSTRAHTLITAVLSYIGFIAAYFIRFYLMPGVINYSFTLYSLMGLASALLHYVIYSLFFYSQMNLYRRYTRLVQRTVLCEILCVGLTLAALFLINLPLVSRMAVFISGVLDTVFICAKHYVVLRAYTALHRSGIYQRNTLLIGEGPTAQRYASTVLAQPEAGHHLVGYVAAWMFEPGSTRLGGYDDLESVLAATPVDEAIIALPAHEYIRLDHIICLCEKYGVPLRIIPCYEERISYQIVTSKFEDIQMIGIRDIPLNRLYNAFIKRFFDILISLSALIVLSPLMLVIAIGVRISTRDTIFFAQTRIGKNKKPFKMLKFRSMRTNDEEDSAWSTNEDDRRTFFGALIRKLSIDELPQLINVLKGDMSIVGPRPEIPHFVEQFRDEVPLYMIRHMVKPGMTGLAQVSGYRGDTSIRGRIDCDIAYIENWTIWLDIRIILRTFTSLVNDETLPPLHREK
ncbi:MAG: exopolysaccharide biosynthesis polyprenyl glycosylphosphotransferase [Christensenellales bacterium]|jgi:exopolysaccharide biosynthesis polyprenyl glycosylphosphotransferase